MKIYLGIVIFIMILTGLYAYHHGPGVDSASPSPTMTVSASGTPVETAPVGNSIGGNAPLFRLQSFSNVSTGVGDFKGVEGIVLYFWSVSCSTCVNDLSLLVSLEDRYQNRFLPMAINRGDPLPDARGFSDQAGSTSRFPHLLDPSDSVYHLYGGSGAPYYVFIDRNGVLQAIESGSVSQQVIEQDLQKIL